MSSFVENNSPWSVFKTEDGQDYYYNSETSETQWEMPEGFVPVQADFQQTEYDENGYPIAYDENGYLITYDQYGYPVTYDEQGYPIVLDQYGYPITYDEKNIVDYQQDYDDTNKYLEQNSTEYEQESYDVNEYQQEHTQNIEQNSTEYHQELYHNSTYDQYDSKIESEVENGSDTKTYPDISNSAFVYSDGVVFELERNRVFTSRSMEADLELVDYKLQILKSALEQKGTDKEWLVAATSMEYLLVQYLLSVINSANSPAGHLKKASVCLALTGTVVPQLWSQFVCTDKKLELLLHSAVSCVNNVHLLVDQLQQLRSRDSCSGLPYAGFDQRDIKEFNLAEDYNQPDRDSYGNMLDIDLLQDSIQVWLLLLFQWFSSPLSVLSHSLKNDRAKVLGLKPTGSSSSAAEPISTRICSTLVEPLLVLSYYLPDNAFVEFIKALAAINSQFPSIDIIGSSEVAIKVMSLLTDETSSCNSLENLSEGLLHCINEIGYPKHLSREAVPILKLCVDLVDAADSEGFFYSNDVKVLIDVILREFSNNGELDAGQIMYLRLLKSLLNRSTWRTQDNGYKTEEILSMLSAIETNHSGSRQKKSTGGLDAVKVHREVYDLIQDIKDVMQQ